jgi:hypothetical protein
MVTILILVVIGLVVLILSLKYSSKDIKESNHPDACFTCNRGECSGCALEGLAREQASSIMKEMTKRAVEDGAIPYLKRFEK